MSYEQKYLEAEPYSIHYSSDEVNKIITTSKPTNNFSSYIQNNETVDKQMDNLMEFVFGDVLFREVE